MKDRASATLELDDFRGFVLHYTLAYGAAFEAQAVNRAESPAKRSHMKAARSVMARTTIMIALCLALVPVVGRSESLGRRMEPVNSSQPAPEERSGFEMAMSMAMTANPKLKDRVAVQPLVGPVKSVKAPNLRKNLSTLNGQVKNLATGAYSAAKKAGPFVGSLATAAAHGAVGGAAFKFGGKLIGRLK